MPSLFPSWSELRNKLTDIPSLKVSDLLKLFDSSEVWRPIQDYSEYSVSSWGRVRGTRTEFLSPADTKGYLHVSLSLNGQKSTKRISHLVAQEFWGAQPFEGARVAHNDGDSHNNRASNLRWTNDLDNQADVERHGRRPKGSEVFLSVLTEDDIPNIRTRIRSRERYADIASDYNVSVSTICLIKQGRTWRHV